MTAHSSETSIGARIRATRKARGIRTTRELANLITGTTLSESIIENIESGRKVNLDISQLFNIAMALEVPPSYLLAPVGSPDSIIDIAGLSDAFRRMTAIEFDAWMSGATGTNYTPVTANERYARLELEALRELNMLDAEVERLLAAMQLAQDAIRDDGILNLVTSYRERIEHAQVERSRLHLYLKSSGWNLAEPKPDQDELDRIYNKERPH